MAIRKCANGHTYNDDEYASCPFCNPGAGFAGYGASSNVATVNAGKTACPSPMGAYGSGIGVSAANAGKTTAPSSFNLSGMADEGTEKPGYHGYAGAAPVDQFGHTIAPSGLGGNIPAADVGKTIPPSHLFGGKVTDEHKTVGVMNLKNGTKPVVGWLVGLSGNISGKDYKLYCGINSIGRSHNNVVCLDGCDETVSRDKHAVLSYDPDSNSFFLERENGLAYVNGKVVHGYAELAAYDIIKLANQQLIFLPLCSDKFVWDSETLNK